MLILKKRGKRGLSAIVTMMIIVLLVLVAIGIVWFVLKNFFGTGAESIELGRVLINLDIKNIEVSDGNVTIKVKRNSGAGDIVGLKFAISDGISSEIFDEEINIKELEEKTFTFKYDSLVKEVRVAPIIKTDTGKELVGDVVRNFEIPKKQIIKNAKGISWWKFDGNTIDELGFANGTINYGVDCNADGKFGKACSFDGTNGFINTSQILDSDQTKPFTMHAWIKMPSNNRRWRTIFSTSNGAEIAISPASNMDVRMGQKTINELWWVVGDVLSVDKWYNIVGVYNRTDASLYVNGELNAGPGTFSFSNNHGDFLIGGLTLNGEDLFYGTIDEPIIFNKSLNEKEIKALYNLDLS